MSEKFDIIDQNAIYLDRVEERDECHKKGLWHKAVFVFIINSKNQVLLQRRSITKKMWPGLLDITAGGHVLAGEFGFEAIIRELKEEIGIQVNKQDLTFISSFISKNIKDDIIDNHFNEFYIINKDIDISNIKLQKDEVSEVIWMDKKEIIDRINSNFNGITDKKGCWDYLLRYYKWLENKKI